MGIDLYCSECGEELSVSISRTAKSSRVEVVPCESCLREAEEEGYRAGLHEGPEEG